MTILDDLFRLKDHVGPQSLTQLCCKLICDELNIISSKDKESDYRYLHKGLILPSEICDRLVEYALQNNAIEDHDCFFTIFECVSTTKLKHVKLVNSNITDLSVPRIVEHKPVELELRDCAYLTDVTIELINARSENLQSLLCDCPSVLKLENPEYLRRGYVFKAPNLRRLALGYAQNPTFQYHLLLAGFPNLTHLELSNSYGVGDLAFNTLVPNLVSLTLYNVNLHPRIFVQSVCELKNLRHLDISQSNNECAIFPKPNKFLSDIVTGLPQLASLDISGTNLAGVRSVEYIVSKKNRQKACCGILGLMSRMEKPLEFLGLCGTHHTACQRPGIPAKVIAGDADEDQILIAAHVCMDNKPKFLQRILNDLCELCRYENCQRMDQAICIVLDAMEKYPNEKHIQMSGAATLYYILRTKVKGKFEVPMKQRVISILLAAMSIHKNVEYIMRYGCLALYQFRIPQDVMSNYETLVKVLLYSTRYTGPESLIQRIGIHLLNCLACYVEGREKRLLGKLKCVKVMLRLVKERVENDSYDEVLEIAWATMWNMTDETPKNCSRFLQENGMSLFLKCVEQYPEKEAVLRNMMGLLGNVAEVDYLREQFMQERYITVIVNLLRINSDSIEVSYNAAGILAHMASDGADAWTMDKPSRSKVLEFMVETIEKWNLYAERNINYRSFLPLLRLLDVFHTPQCQHWAVWALANLTNVYPDKYCSLIVKESVIEKLNALILDPRPYARIKELAQFACDNCSHYSNITDEANHRQLLLDGGYNGNS